MRGIVSLTKNHEFGRVYRRAKGSVHPLLVTYALRRGHGVNRVGITASKKIGNACKRNRARRLIREAYRSLQHELPPGYDFVFVARARTTGAKMPEVQRAMRSHLANLT